MISPKVSSSHPKLASAISIINDQDVMPFLSDFAALNSYGTLESHADCDQLMDGPAGAIQGLATIFAGGATFYPEESITFILENGTKVGPEPWLALYNSQGDTGSLETGGDFYNFFILGFYPASYLPFGLGDEGHDEGGETVTSSATATPTGETMSSTTMISLIPSSWGHPAYPTPNIWQPDLGAFGGGFVSGYFLKDSIAVLSIPSFDEYGPATNTFSQTVANFLNVS